MEFINQNILLIAVVVVSGLGLLWPLLVGSAGKGLDPVAATQLINREDATILDVREADEFAGGHLPEARNIPLGKLAERVGELEKFKDRALLVCCAAGVRSGKACAELRKNGFTKMHSLAGGVDAWVAAGYPVKKGTRNK
ncbi:rhodanese-like domain-containing protein [Azonexus sp.]|jgi:rhodanese-related sulfurtransferase|uniref:rhodanese-like domain-containing protein n=1 Tax=Azonexus sp. TaxID=1872668 RepID=UPI0028229A12|nr:rhodanese-like domain-containing protein [Azonexus sp.]MDR1994614.1 rhodanese-like domain-containing protein [Azonexus sp.]